MYVMKLQTQTLLSITSCLVRNEVIYRKVIIRVTDIL